MKELNAQQTLEAPEMNLLTFRGGSLFLSQWGQYILFWPHKHHFKLGEAMDFHGPFKTLPGSRGLMKLCLVPARLLKTQKISTLSKTVPMKYYIIPKYFIWKSSISRLLKHPQHPRTVHISPYSSACKANVLYLLILVHRWHKYCELLRSALKLKSNSKKCNY